MIEIDYPPLINPASIILGKLRDVYNAEMNEEAAHFKRGERSEHVNVLGVKGELIAQYFLFTRRSLYTATKLLAQKPLAEPDITVGDKKFDVKAIRTDAPDLLVNAVAHAKAKGITDYWFVQCFDGNRARFWFYTHAEVSEWPQKDCKYSMAHYRTIKDIKKDKTDE